VSLAQVQAEQRLRIAAGAIRSTIDQDSDPNNFILTSEWNIIGQNDGDAAPGAPPAAPAEAASAGFASNGILAEFHGNGASAKTAAQDHLPPGPGASVKMATTDRARVMALKQRFNTAAAVTGLPPALLAAIASRESRCGAALDANGNGDNGNAFGIMQVDRRSHVPAGEPDPRSQAHIDQAAGILKAFLDRMIVKFASAPPCRQLQAAVAAYNCGASAVASPDTADAHTTGHDYSNDVWERARFYAAGW
jgi:soluble lytic murein transglycosylase-like protein